MRSVHIVLAVFVLATVSACASGPAQRELVWAFDQADPGVVQGLTIATFESDSDVRAMTFLLQAQQSTPEGRQQIRFMAPSGAVNVRTSPQPAAIIERELRTMIAERYGRELASPVTVRHDPYLFFARYTPPPSFVAASADAIIMVHLQVVTDGELAFDQVVGCEATERGAPVVASLGRAALEACLDGLVTQIDALDGFWAPFEGEAS
jgi:hypothetical protein